MHLNLRVVALPWLKRNFKMLLQQRACAKHKPCKCVRETIYRLATLINKKSFLWFKGDSLGVFWGNYIVLGRK